MEFGEFPRPAWAVGSYSSGPPAGGTPQILVFKTLRMTSRPALYNEHILLGKRGCVNLVITNPQRSAPRPGHLRPAAALRPRVGQGQIERGHLRLPRQEGNPTQQNVSQVRHGTC